MQLQVRPVDNCLAPDSLSWREWEALVSRDAGSGFMQSLHWAAFKRAQGLDYLHLGLYDQSHTLVGGGIFYLSANSKGAGILVCPEGPVLPSWSEQGAQLALRLLLQEAQSQARRLEFMAVRIEPRIETAPVRAFRGFGRAPCDLVPRETLYLDLAKPESELLAAMRPKGRYNIRLAQRHGVTVQQEEFSLQTVDRFYAVLMQASRRDDFVIEPLNFFVCLAQTLCPRGIARLLFAEHEGQTLGALLLITYGDRATYLYGGISNEKRQLMAGYALQWAAMQLAKGEGCRTYDLYGFDRFAAPQNPYARFSRFKRQFGGQVRRFVGAHDYYFTERLADVVIKAIAEIKASSDSSLVREQSSRSEDWQYAEC